MTTKAIIYYHQNVNCSLQYDLKHETVGFLKWLRFGTTIPVIRPKIVIMAIDIQAFFFKRENIYGSVDKSTQRNGYHRRTICKMKRFYLQKRWGKKGNQTSESDCVSLLSLLGFWAKSMPVFQWIYIHIYYIQMCWTFVRAKCSHKMKKRNRDAEERSTNKIK